MTTKNFNVKNGLTTGNIVLDAATGNITATNANLGNLAVANYFSGDGSLLTNLNVSAIGTVANANYAAYAGVVTTNAQPNITSVGSLTSLTVTGNASAGNISTTGNLDAGNLNVSGVVSSNLIPSASATYQLGNAAQKWKELYVSGNIYFGSATLTDVSGTFTTSNANVSTNLIAGNVYANSGTIQGSLLTGTLTTAAQPNVTSLGTLSNLSVTGNVTTGGIKTDNYYYANGSPVDFQQAAGSNAQLQFNLNGDFGASSALTFNTTSSTLTAGNISTTGLSATTIAGDLTTAAQPNVTSVGTLTGLTVNGVTSVTDATVSTSTSTGAFKVTGGAGIGGNLNVNGKTVLGDDVTVGGNLTINGTLTTVNSETVTVVDPIFSLHTGTNNATLTTDDGKDVGLLMNYFKSTAKSAFVGWTNDSGFLEYYANATESAGVISGTYGTIKGLSYISTVATGTAPFTVTSTTQVANLNAATAGTVTASSQPNITSVGTLVSLSVTGTLAAGAFSGDGGSLSNIAGGNVTGTVSSATSATTAGTVTTAAQPNITSVGTLSSLSVTGNITAGNVAGGNLVSANYIAGTLTTAAQPNITSVGTLGNLVVTDDITANTMHIGTGITIAGSTITAATFNGNVSGNITGSIAAPGNNTEVTFNDAGYLGSTTKLTINKTSGLLTVTGNIAASNANLGNLVTANYFTGDGGLLSNIAGGNVTGTVSSATTATSATSATTAGTVTTAAQPNITSVGTLSSLNVTGTMTSGNVSTGNIAGNITTAAQPNITSVGTLSGLTVSGTSTQAEIKLNTGISSNRTSVTVSGATLIDQFPGATYRGAKYVISGKSDNGFQSAEVLLVHSDTQSYITIYGFLTSGTSDVFDVTSNVDSMSGNVRLYATNVTTNTSLNLVATYVQD